MGIEENINLLLAAVLTAFAGALIGKKLLKKITTKFVQITVTVMIVLILIAIGLGFSKNKKPDKILVFFYIFFST
ncbi:hypothetical protein N9D80_01730 [Flavobacteriales bacterium]|nr:hypothetical protein [Flavobacteriales bacterium]